MVKHRFFKKDLGIFRVVPEGIKKYSSYWRKSIWEQRVYTSLSAAAAVEKAFELR